MIPTEYQWTTQAGQVLDIRWMDTPHLVNTVNMLIRKPEYKLNRQRVENMARTVQSSPGNIVFANMVKELQARMVLEWATTDKGGFVYDQIMVGVSKAREPIKVMCMLRAMFDTQVVLGILDYRETVKWLRHEPDEIFRAVESQMRISPHPDIFRLWAKYTEYRLWKT